MATTKTVDLILDAGMALVAGAGPDGASVRAIADRAGVSAPAVQHHFRAKESLLNGIYARAVDCHLEVTAAALLPVVLPHGERVAEPVRQSVIVEMATSVMQEWLREEGGATLTSVMLHLLVHAVRDASYGDLASRWLAGTVTAFESVGVAGTGDAQFLVELLIGTALVSAPGRFRCENDILNRELFRSACGARDWDGGFWLERYRTRHERTRPDSDPSGDGEGLYARLLDVCVALTAEVGADALSYRKIAARAKVAPSSVLYHFPNRTGLLMALYREVHRRFMLAAGTEEVEPRAQAAPAAGLFAKLIVDEMAGEAPLFLTSCELFLASWRETELAPDALFMRLERGKMHGVPQLSPSERQRAHLHSIWSLGLALTQYSHASSHRSRDVELRLRDGIRFLDD